MKNINLFVGLSIRNMCTIYLSAEEDLSSLHYLDHDYGTMDSKTWLMYCVGCMVNNNSYVRIHVWIIHCHNRFVDLIHWRIYTSHGLSELTRTPVEVYESDHELFHLVHRADNSNELPDLHTTHTFACEVHASAVTEWPPAYLHKLPPRGHQWDNWRKLKLKSIAT